MRLFGRAEPATSHVVCAQQASSQITWHCPELLFRAYQHHHLLRIDPIDVHVPAHSEVYVRLHNSNDLKEDELSSVGMNTSESAGASRGVLWEASLPVQLSDNFDTPQSL